MRKLLTGTAMAVMFAAAPALADSTTKASGELVTSPTVENQAVSKPADITGSAGGTSVETGTKATTAGSSAITGADGEPQGSVDMKAGAETGTTLKTGKPATTAGGEVVPDTNQDPVSSDDS
ncbi:hypothetical protein [Microbaculum marinum]|uniref:Uncharacterized protein n=1 Tax=Microbaculum marinum TaxID=1764581 RepID=A0AAW9RNW8_9HYPH